MSKLTPDIQASRRNAMTFFFRPSRNTIPELESVRLQLETGESSERSAQTGLKGCTSVARVLACFKYIWGRDLLTGQPGSLTIHVPVTRATSDDMKTMHWLLGTLYSQRPRVSWPYQVFPDSHGGCLLTQLFGKSTTLKPGAGHPYLLCLNTWALAPDLIGFESTDDSRAFSLESFLRESGFPIEEIVSDRVPANRIKNLVILCSGSLGPRLTQSFAETVLSHSQLRVQIYATQEERAKLVDEDSEAAYDRADAIVVCLTPDAEPDFVAQVGLVYSSARKHRIPFIKLQLLEADPIRSLDTPLFDAHSHHDLFKLLSIVLPEHTLDQALFDSSFDSWKSVLDVHAPAAAAHAIRTEVNQLISVAHSVTDNRTLRHGRIFRHSVVHLLAKTHKRLHFLNTDHELQLPASDYPSVLMDLQQRFGIILKAVALLDQVAHIWHPQSSAKILKYTSPESCRVFVYDSPELLMDMPSDELGTGITNWTNNVAMLTDHSKRYNVWVMARSNLPHPDRFDFGILELNKNDRFAAEYDRTDLAEQLVRFSTNPDTIEQFLRDFELIVNSKASIRIPKHSDKRKTLFQDAAAFRDRLFTGPASNSNASD